MAITEFVIIAVFRFAGKSDARVLRAREMSYPAAS
jgi:hypothetical protein